jgi:DNA-binding CsgD family transcriptional regulator/tetratricopeptide (TPR) repeat protein
VLGGSIPQPPLVGRRVELATLEEIVRCLPGGGRLVVVEGEAGIGKSRLIEAAAQMGRDAGLTVLSSQAEQLETHRPFGAIIDCIGRERLGDRWDAWELGLDRAGERLFRVAEAMLECLDTLCVGTSVIVAIEDLHWADTGTLGVLGRVAAEIEQFPAALVVSMRPQPRRPQLERLLGVFAARGSANLRVGPLDQRSCEQLLESLVGASPGQRLARQADRAGGNPLFLYELVGALVADGAIVYSKDAAELASDAVAPSLPLTILRRLSFAPPELLGLLGLASVLGVSFAAGDLALLAQRPVSSLVDALRSARLAGVLTERGERLSFRHELVRDALYYDLPLTVRRGLHAEFASALAAAGRPPAQAADHVIRAAAPGDERAIASIVSVARDLVGRAPGATASMHQHAIGLSASPVAMREQLLPELADALIAAGQLREGEQVCREALSRDLGPEWAGQLRLHLMFLLLRQGRAREAVRAGEECLSLAQGVVDERNRERISSLMSMALVFCGDVAPAERAARAVLDTSRDELARALATNTLASAADGRGAFAEAADLIAPSVRWADLRGSRAAYDARPHMILSLMLIRLDRFDEAQATIRRGRHAAESLGIADALPVFHYQQALLDFCRGRLDDALAELDTRSRIVEQMEIGWHLPAESLRALIAIHRDDLIAARRHVAAAEREAAQGGPPHGIDLMTLARARLLEATGDIHAALEAIASAVAASSSAGTITCLPVLGPELARLAAAAGDPGQAAAAIPSLDQVARLNPGARSLQAYALQGHGLLDGDRDALAAAAGLLRDSGRALEAACAAEAVAALSAAEARDPLEAARQTYHSCRAPRDLARVEAAMRALGVRRGVPGARRRPDRGWQALTDTELKVVRLVAERLTNPEIAQRMFISRRTVQTHVSHALAKLGVATRRELAAEAGRHAGWRLRMEDASAPAQQPQPALDGAPSPAIDTDGA